MEGKESAREIRAVEPRSVPRLSFLFGYGATLPPVAAACAVWLPGWAPSALVDLAIIYGGALLAFFAGVLRGLSFRTTGGPTRAQIATMLWLFVLGGAALALLLLPAHALALGLLLAGHASLGVLDPIAARSAEAPLFFARLRPIQMSIASAAYLALLVHEL